MCARANLKLSFLWGGAAFGFNTGPLGGGGMNARASLKLSFLWGGAAFGDWMQRSPHERFGSFHWSKLVGHDNFF